MVNSFETRPVCKVPLHQKYLNIFMWQSPSDPLSICFQLEKNPIEIFRFQ